MKPCESRAPLLVYIHGFASSPRSEKANELRCYARKAKLPIDLVVPRLSDRPECAFAQLSKLIEKEIARGRQQIALIGSSLGGFWATVLVERYGLRAVLINPAVKPAQYSPEFIGAHQNMYTGKWFHLNARDGDILRELEPDGIMRTENLWLLVQTADETLDYRQAVTYYRGVRQTIEPGGSHRFEGFIRYLPDIMTFLQMPTESD